MSEPVALLDLRAGTRSTRSTGAETSSMYSPQNTHRVLLPAERADGGQQHQHFSQNKHVFSSLVLTYLNTTKPLPLHSLSSSLGMSCQEKVKLYSMVGLSSKSPSLTLSHGSNGTSHVPPAQKILFLKISPFSSVPSALLLLSIAKGQKSSHTHPFTQIDPESIQIVIY